MHQLIPNLHNDENDENHKESFLLYKWNLSEKYKDLPFRKIKLLSPQNDDRAK